MAFDIDTASPADTQIISTFPGTQRAIHVQIKDIITAEHVEATGRHNFPVVADFAALDALANKSNGMLAGQTDIASLMQYQAGAFISLNGSIYLASGSVAALDKTTLSDGQFLIESDTRKPYYWDSGDAAFNPILGEGWIVSDEADDSDQAIGVKDDWEDVTSAAGVGSVLGVEIVCPDDDRVYEHFVMAFCKGQAKANGLEMGWQLSEKVDAGAFGMVDEAYKVSTGGATALDAVLMRHVNPSVAASTYQYTVQVATSVIADAVANPSASFHGTGLDTLAPGNLSRIIGFIRVREKL